MISSQEIREIKNIVRSCHLSTEVKTMHLRSLETLAKKSEDDNIYIGVVGEFSSGKSTLLNSLLNETFFVMHSLQGTTTVPCMIRFGKSPELSVIKKNGERISSKGNFAKLLKIYTHDYYYSLPFSEKTNIKLADFCGCGHDRRHMSKLFDLISTSNQYYADIDYIELKLNSEFLKGGIVMIDTPGIDSLNKYHQQITEKTLKELCDLAMIVSPADHAYSQTLSNFIEDHVLNTLDHIVFAITKCELINNATERDDIKQYVSTKCDQELGRDDVKAYLAPTRLDLLTKKIVDRDESDKRIFELHEDDRRMLVENYAKDMKDCIQEISGKRSEILESKFKYLAHDIIGALKDELNKSKMEVASEMRELKAHEIEPLEKYIQSLSIDSFLELTKKQKVEKIKSDINKKGHEVLDEIHKFIDAASEMNNPKNSMQNVMNLDEVHSIRREWYERNYASFCEQRNVFYDAISFKMNEICLRLKDVYQIGTASFSSSAHFKAKKEIKYKELKYDMTGLTTGLLKRRRTPKSAICIEMKNHTQQYVNSEIENHQEYYSALMDISVSEYSQEVLKYITAIVKKNRSKVDRLIAEYNEQGSHLQAYADFLSKSISKIEALAYI